MGWGRARKRGGRVVERKEGAGARQPSSRRERARQASRSARLAACPLHRPEHLIKTATDLAADHQVHQGRAALQCATRTREGRQRAKTGGARKLCGAPGCPHTAHPHAGPARRAAPPQGVPRRGTAARRAPQDVLALPHHAPRASARHMLSPARRAHSAAVRTRAPVSGTIAKSIAPPSWLAPGRSSTRGAMLARARPPRGAVMVPARRAAGAADGSGQLKKINSFFGPEAPPNG